MTGSIQRNESARTAASGLRLLLAASALAFAAACSSPEERLERFNASGMEFLEEGEFGKANVQFQNALKIDEEHVPSLLGLAKIAEERQEFERMFGLLQRVVRLDPNQKQARVDLGKIYLLGGDETAALEHAEEVLQLDAGFLPALALKSAVQLRLGDYAGAVELARRVVAEDPGNAEAVTVLATERMLDDDLEGGLAELEKGIAVNSELAVLQLLRIRVLKGLEREDDVIEAYDRLVSLHPEEASYRRAYARELVMREDYDATREQLEKVAEIEKNNLDAKLDVIRLIAAISGPQEAEARLRAYLAAEPDNTDISFALIDFLNSVDKSGEAEEMLSALAQSSDEVVALRAKNRIAGDLLQRRDNAQAKAIIDEILEADSGNTEALIKRAGVRIDDEDFDNAIVDLRTALNNEPDSYEAMVMMSVAFERQDNIAFAQAELAKAFDASERAPRIANYFARFLIRHDNVQRAEEVLVASLAAHERDLDNLRLLAVVRLNMQDWRGAEEVAQIIASVEQSEANEGLVDNIRTAAFSGLGEYDRVIETLADRNNDEPLESRPLATLVNAYIRSGRADEAETLLQSVIDSGRDAYGARILMARVHGAQDAPEKAEAVLIEAAEQQPERAEAYELLYRYYMGAGQIDRAAALIDGGLEKAPDNVALKVFKADILIASNRLAEALALYDELLALRPNDLIIANNFVSLSSELRLDEQSVARALEVSQVIEGVDNPLFKDSVGWAHYRAGLYQEAVSFLSEAAAGAPDNPEVLYHLGAAQAAAGDPETARGNLQKALEAGGPDFRLANEVRTLLEGL